MFLRNFMASYTRTPSPEGTPEACALGRQHLNSPAESCGPGLGPLAWATLTSILKRVIPFIEILEIEQCQYSADTSVLRGVERVPAGTQLVTRCHVMMTAFNDALGLPIRIRGVP